MIEFWMDIVHDCRKFVAMEAAICDHCIGHSAIWQLHKLLGVTIAALFTRI